MISVLMIGLTGQSYAQKISIEVEIRDGISVVEIETSDYIDAFKLETTDKQMILDEILKRTDLTEDQVVAIWEIEFESDESKDEDRKHDENDDRNHKGDIKPQNCILKEDDQLVVVDKECVYNRFGEIPKENCIVDAADGLIWYDAECVYYNEYDSKHRSECIIEEDEHVIVADESCLFEKYDKIPHKECAKLDQGLVYFDKQCVRDSKTHHPDMSPVSDDSQKIIQKLEQENRELKEKINQLEKKIDDLNQILKEQLRVIYEWVLKR